MKQVSSKLFLSAALSELLGYRINEVLLYPKKDISLNDIFARKIERGSSFLLLGNE